MRTSRLVTALAGLAVLPLAGCGDRLGSVTGTVNRGGKPLPAGVINFFPDQGMPAAASVTNGAFTLPSLPYGTYRRHLRQGLDMLCEALWQQEIQGPR